MNLATDLWRLWDMWVLHGLTISWYVLSIFSPNVRLPIKKRFFLNLWVLHCVSFPPLRSVPEQVTSLMRICVFFNPGHIGRCRICLDRQKSTRWQLSLFFVRLIIHLSSLQRQGTTEWLTVAESVGTLHLRKSWAREWWLTTVKR